MIKLKLILFIFIWSNPYTIFSQKIILSEKPVTEFFYGKPLIDSYRFIENTNDILVQKWFKQNESESKKIFENISGRKELLNELIKIDKKESFSIISLTSNDGNCFFYLKKNENEKNFKLYYKKNKESKETLLFDPINYKKETQTEYTIAYIKPSWNSKKIALGLTKIGEEIGEIAFLDVDSKILFPYHLTNCWPSELGGINWLPNDESIIYIHIPVIDNKDPDYILNTESVIYKLGDNVQNRTVIFSKKNNPEINISSADFPEINKLNLKDGFILGKLNGASSYLDYYYAKMDELNSKKINWKPLFKKEDGFKSPIIIGDNIYCLSSKNTPNYKIIKIGISNSNFNNPETIVDELKNEIINDFTITSDGLFFTTTKNGVEAKLFFVKDKTIKQIKLPIEAGSIGITSRNKYDKEISIYISGWLNNDIKYNYDINTNIFSEQKINPTVTYPEYKNIIVKEIEIISHDGVLVPVSLIFKKGMKKNSNNNVMLYSYGAYGESLNPWFQPIFLSWVLNDGIFVIPHVRGGGEKGDDWYKAGFKKTKPNTWKDLIATAEYLIKEKFTSNKKIAIYSGSAGGITVGRAITEKPDLFKVMICDNGDLNSVRIKDTPNGPNNMKEFGDPDIEEEFNALLEMDAYQHIKKDIDYPACLLSVGMNDARVAPWTSAKFVAKLKSSTTSNNPIVFKVNYYTGHGVDNSNLQLYNDFADNFAFAFWQLGHPKFKLIKK
jgi:prolyl oligopeptidase